MKFYLKLCQTNWNVARNNIDVVVDTLSSQIYSLHLVNNWYLEAHQRGFMRFGAIRPKWRASSESNVKSFRLYYGDP